MFDKKANGYIDKTPKFRYAVYSKRADKIEHKLESSADDKSQAARFFDLYKTLGLTDTSFFLVDWQERKRLAEFRPKES